MLRDRIVGIADFRNSGLESTGRQQSNVTQHDVTQITQRNVRQNNAWRRRAVPDPVSRCVHTAFVVKMRYIQ